MNEIDENSSGALKIFKSHSDKRKSASGRRKITDSRLDKANSNRSQDLLGGLFFFKSTRFIYSIIHESKKLNLRVVIFRVNFCTSRAFLFSRFLLIQTISVRIVDGQRGLKVRIESVSQCR